MSTAVDQKRAAIVSAIDDNADAIIALSKFIHANPEIAMQEIKTPGDIYPVFRSLLAKRNA